MLNFKNTELQQLVVHHVGNKSDEEGIKTSKSETLVDEELGKAWIDFATLSFNGGGEHWFKMYRGNINIGQIKIVSNYD